jgi:hypothetical protein
MPIEDIHFLYKNGIKENKVIFIDSSMRNKVAYVTPSEYVIDFAEPFYNVYGLEILDASIPRTMYNIDTYNNSLKLGIGPRARQNIHTTVHIPVKDYTSDTLIATLTNCMLSIGDNHYALTVNTFGEGTSKIQYNCPVPFVLDMQNSTLSEVLGYDQPGDKADTTNFRLIDNGDGNTRLFGCLNKDVEGTNLTNIFGIFYPYVADVTTISNTLSYTPITMTKRVSQPFSFPSQTANYTIISEIYVQLFSLGTVLNSSTIVWNIFKGSTPTAFPVSSGTFTINRVTLSAMSLTNTLLTTNTTYCIVMYDTVNTDAANAYAVPYNKGATFDGSFSSDSGVIWTTIASNPSNDVHGYCITLKALHSTLEYISNIEQPLGKFYTTPIDATVTRCTPLTQTSWIAQPIQIQVTVIPFSVINRIRVQLVKIGAVDPSTVNLVWSINALDPSNYQPSSDILYQGTFTIDPVTLVGEANIIDSMIISNQTLYYIMIHSTNVSSPTSCLAIPTNVKGSFNISEILTGQRSTQSGQDNTWNDLSTPTSAFYCVHVSGRLTNTVTVSDDYSGTSILGPLYKTPPDPRKTLSNVAPLTITSRIAQPMQLSITTSAYITIERIVVQLQAIGTPNLANCRMKWDIVSNTMDKFLPDKVVYSGTFTIDPITLTASSGDLTLDEDAFILIQNNTSYWLIIYEDMNADADNCMAVTFNTFMDKAVDDSFVGLYSDDGGILWTYIDRTKFFCIQIDIVTKNFYMYSPGILSLVGERFVILRCPEIEQFVSGSVAFGNNSPGIALFKMGVVGYSDSRFDFASIRYKEFHPIGKLNRLTFRYERMNGKLYDFKGVNHHLLVVVRHFAAKQTEHFTHSSLNPNYQSNFLQYIKNSEEKETSDIDDEPVDNRTFKNVLLKEEQKHVDKNELKYVGNVYHKPVSDVEDDDENDDESVEEDSDEYEDDDYEEDA